MLCVEVKPREHCVSQTVHCNLKGRYTIDHTHYEGMLAHTVASSWKSQTTSRIGKEHDKWQPSIAMISTGVKPSDTVTIFIR